MSFLDRIEQLEREKRDLIAALRDCCEQLEHVEARRQNGIHEASSVTYSVLRLTNETLARHEPNQNQSLRP